MIYFDSAATTPMDTKVVNYITELMNNIYGNPSSIHQIGQNAKAIIEKSRYKIAKSLNVKTKEIFFTSGGTESNNLVLRSVLSKNDHFITSSIEHSAILKTKDDLEKKGVLSTVIHPNKYGQITLEKIKNSLKPNTKLVSIMYVNNELGTINDIEKIAEFLHHKKILFHTDAVQAVGKIDIDLNKLKVNFLSASAHKFHGPKGVGFLYCKNKNIIHPQITGGGQERNIRGGTENISGIGGMGFALEMANENMDTNTKYMKKLENKLFNELESAKIKFRRNGTNHVVGIYNMTFFDVPGNLLIVNLDLENIAISYGSACSSGSLKPSPVHELIGLSKYESECTVRISLSKLNTCDEIVSFTIVLKKVIHKIKKRNICQKNVF